MTSTRLHVPVALLVAGLLASLGLVTAASAESSVPVVVQAGDADRAADAVESHGGVVERELDLIGAVAALLPPAATASVDDLPGVTVTPDTPVHFTAGEFTAADSEAQLASLNPGEMWSADTGAGVGVALIDTGVVETPELAGRVVHGPDYSEEGDSVDRYGHGTFMAGLIAADGTAGAGLSGVAPGAHIVSLKLAGRDGVTTLSKVLDAIGWVVTNQDEHGIRVLNLSFGVPTNVAPEADPLAAAVEAAWASGVTVVAASGNQGDGVVTSPGRDPWIVTVGATETHGTATVADDSVPEWSGAGRVTRYHRPDVLAPGASVVSLRAPGSYVDDSFPEGRVGEHYFRGSGTSMSTALVSGAVAALAELRPYATPDDLKGALVSTALPVAGSSAGAVDLAAADAAAADPAWRQTHPITFRGLDGKLRNGMPWAQASSPSPDEAWARIKWADGEWARIKWAEGEWARIKWADSGFARIKWADSGFARIKWADANFARIKWADANFARIKWADGEWARIKWAEASWSGQAWLRLKWATSIWDQGQS